MKEYKIIISRDSVFQRVSRQMDWEGTRGSSSDADYGRLAVSEGDRALLHSFFDESAMHAIDLCRPFLKSVSNTDESLELTIALSDDSDPAVITSLRPALFNMVSAKVLALWQEIVTPEKTALTLAKQEEAERRFTGALYHHPRPHRNPTPNL